MDNNPIANVAVYGYMVVYKPPGSTPQDHWIVDQCDEYRNLPAHYMTVEEARDRVHFLWGKGVEARIAALLTDARDTPEEFEENRNRG